MTPPGSKLKIKGNEKERICLMKVLSLFDGIKREGILVECYESINMLSRVDVVEHILGGLHEI